MALPPLVKGGQGRDASSVRSSTFIVSRNGVLCGVLLLLAAIVKAVAS